MKNKVEIQCSHSYLLLSLTIFLLEKNGENIKILNYFQLNLLVIVVLYWDCCIYSVGKHK